MAVINSPIGMITIHFDGDYVRHIVLFSTGEEVADELPTLSKVEQAVSRQILAYFTQAHCHWSIKFIEQGTVFQRKVWHYLQTIPLGEMRSYSDVAQVLVSSPRAVANACRANPYPIVIPCHRVVAKSGLGGFAGKTSGKELIAKQWLLDHEQR